MSPFIILTIIAMLYLSSRPVFRFHITRDGYYLSRDWTSFVNSFFIALVVCSHGLNLFQTNIRDYFPEKCVAYGIGQFGQLMVTTFFFYSGYGIMLSLLNRGGYARMLIFPRFVSLSLNFVLAVMVYFTFHCMLQGEIRWSDFLAGLHEYKALGNPTWFILMTLLTYILTFSCFSLTGGGRPTLFVMCLTALLIAAIFLVSRIKPSHWVNTILCFPAGMFYYLYGEKLENLLRKTHLPAIVWAGLLLVSGKAIYDANIWPAIYSQNVGGVLFALGITWFVGSFAWKKPSHALVWLGGSGLFVVYMFHLLPMRVMTHLGLNTNNPYLVWLAVAISTAVLVLMASYGYKKLNTLLFSK